MTTLPTGLIVSCQALENEPLHSEFIMGRMAIAAVQGGAKGIRANSAKDIQEIKKQVAVPIIGIVKRDYEDSDVFITATMKEVEELIEVGVDVIALDATQRLRPNGVTLQELVHAIRSIYPKQAIMADCATLNDCIEADRLGFDYISTTLHGYTKETNGSLLYHDDFKFLKDVLDHVSRPVIAEGNILTPEMAKRCMNLGTYAVVVGGAITRPHQITARFDEALASSLKSPL
ncbi:MULTISPECIES: N-acetylmannosamine-6-phosphate 2-epimerase [unclassified Exiguobacterium]|uniref:N-acetylmannosamine-6-phosphate 2-epimerase n=1 Tax=unclassified Exiguobacterium TaxID=2644629 RepID=UPI001BE776C9|nr:MULTISPECIES: N-acetylmannosamine-6-phosphate 2-epimerase [unclassified Exiguobacterium]